MTTAPKPFTGAKERAKRWVDEYHNAARYRKALRAIADDPRTLSGLSRKDLELRAEVYRFIARKALGECDV